VTGVDEVVPRWEWRTFDEVGPAAARLASETPHQVHDSDEMYMVTGPGEDTVKVRDGLVDVKQLEEVDDHGLERWRPVLKRPSTLTADDVHVLARALHATALRVVAVHQRRARYTVGGCAAELVDLRVDGAEMRTFAIESEDRPAMMRLLREMGLAGHPNVSYPRHLRRVAGLLPERGAVIDIGTNSVKLHVAERDGAVWRVLADGATVTRLGEGLRPGGELAEAPMARTADAVCGMALQARRAGAPVVAVGTAGLRMAANAAAFAALVRDRCSVEVEVISGEEEARLGFAAATAAAGRDGALMVVETGGGSSQFTSGAGGRIIDRLSIDLGAVAVTERFGLDRAVSPADLGRAEAAVAAELGVLEGRRPDAVVGIGGVFTNLAAVMHGLAAYDPEVVEGTVLDRAEIDRQIDRYRGMDAEGRRGIVGLQPARAEVILGGAVIVRAVLGALDRDAVAVSDRGLRHALVWERF
jgi:exopolyphosphatase/guanosine-5'-triphosphate,3'-diphosphate pyrophosphatase